MKLLKIFFLVTDIGFILYWLIVLLHVMPDSWLFKDYDNPILVAWNWSFFPLDMLISATGLIGLFCYYKKNVMWKGLCLVSLVLTSCSGLQAISFWALRLDFDLLWWIPNLYLLLYPIALLIIYRDVFFCPKSLENADAASI